MNSTFTRGDFFDVAQSIVNAQQTALKLGRSQMAREISEWAIKAEQEARAENWPLSEFVTRLGERLKEEAAS